MARVSIATTTRADYPDLSSENAGILSALDRVGVEASLVPWHGDLSTWTSSDLVIVRTTWDYPEYPDAFEAWLAALDRVEVPVMNPVDAIRWNLNKMYLLDLQSSGVPTVPVELVGIGTQLEPASHMRVVKPQVGVGSGGAFLVEPGEAPKVPFDAVVNPFMPKVAQGERSVFVVDGEPVCTFRKTPSATDWRVQPQWGGRYELDSAVPDSVLETAVRAYTAAGAAANAEFVYLRVDLLEDNDGEWLVLEVEAIEPSLYASVTPVVCDAIAAKVVRTLHDN